MKNNIKKFILFFTELHRSIRFDIFLLSIFIAASLWIINSSIDAILLQRGSFFQQLTNPDTDVIYMRLVYSATIIVICFIVGILLNRSRKIEKKLTENGQKYRGLLKTAPDGIVIVNSEGDIEIINQQLIKITGYTSEELIGKPIEVLIPERYKNHKQLRDNYIANPHVRMMGTGLELFVQRKDHSEFPAEISLSSFKTENGLIISAAIRDISDRKKNEIMLANAERIARVGSWEHDIHTNRRVWSDEMCRIFEVESGQSVNSYETYLELVHPDDREHINKFYTDIINNSKQHYDIEHRLLMKDGRIKHIHQKCENIFNKNNELISCIGTTIDITERKQVEDKLRSSEEKYRAIFETTQVGMALCKMDGTLVEVNQGFLDIIGYNKEEALKLIFWDISPNKYKEKEAELLQTISKTGRYGPYEKEYTHKNGSLIPVLINGSVITGNDGNDYIWSLVQDISELKHADEKLNYQATHDSLTGLVNRNEFELRAGRLLSSVKQHNDNHALCFLDLDQFKVINDTCGHIAGDELLRQLTSVLQSVVRKRDTLARLGGDEFGILMEHCSLDDAHRVATTVKESIRNYQFIWEGHNFRVGASIGLVPITETSISLTELLKDADAACYMAKDKGRNRVHVYHAEDSEIAKRHGEMQWVKRINEALDNNQFCLYAQAIMPLDARKDKHYELLIRMIDEKGNTIPPGAFLPAAERYNLISQIDHWVIKKTCSLLKDNPEFLNQINFCSINLSGQSLTDHNILEFIISQLKSPCIDGKKICFEITETAAISNLNSAMKFISTIKAFGCRFALDDFGSGLSSFGYLKNLPVDYLKIDGMFVKDIADDPIDHAMVKSINEIGQVMNMQTIAEFVENDVIKGMLKEIGVDYAQGYGIEKPRPFEELLELIS